MNAGQLPYLETFAKAAELSCFTAAGQALLDQVERGKAHLGLVGGKSNSAHLEFRPFACDRMVLVVPEGHPWRRRKRVSLTQLCGQPLVLREAGSGSRWCLEQALAKAGSSVNDLRVALELGSNE